MTQIGIFGGTFDPIHVGHLSVANTAAHGLGLDQVLFVVAGNPWQKVGTRQIAPAALRLAMVEAATADRDDFVASAIEIDRGGSSYTIDTVSELAASHPDASLVLVVGSDVVPDLVSWHRHEELADMVTLCIIDRPGDVGAEPPVGWTFHRVPAPLVALSSTQLRERLAADEPVDYLVPKAALDVYRSWHHEATGSDPSHTES